MIHPLKQNNSSYLTHHLIVKGLYLKPFRKTMMKTSLKQFLKSYPSSINWFWIILHEKSDVIPHLCNLGQKKIFGKKLLHHVIPSSDRAIKSEFIQLFALSRSAKGKSLNLMASFETSFSLKVSHISRKFTR